MSDEDLYCNPQSNIFLQARLQKKPPAKNEKKRPLFGKKAPQPKPPKPLPSKGASPGAELGSLFKSGVMKPSELRKTPVPDRQPVHTSEEAQRESHIVDFKAHLKHVESPIKTAEQNRRISGSEDGNLASSTPETTENEDIKSPPVPVRRSQLTVRRSVPTPDEVSDAIFKYPSIPKRDSVKISAVPMTPQYSIEIDINKNITPEIWQPANNENVPMAESLPANIRPDRPSIEALLADLPPPPELPTPPRRPLRPLSKCPAIPISSFPSLNQHIESYVEVDTCPDVEPDEIYADDFDANIPFDHEEDGDTYADNDVDDPDSDTYADNDVDDHDSGYHVPPTKPPPEAPPAPTSLPPPLHIPAPLYDSPKQACREVAVEGSTRVLSHISVNPEEMDDEIYADDEVVEYPSFKGPAAPTPSPQPPAQPTSGYQEQEEDGDEIYEDGDAPITIVKYPAENYNPDLEDEDDIYDDMADYTPRLQPSPVIEHTPLSSTAVIAPPSLPPPQLPPTGPPPASSTKTKPKGGGLFGIFKKSNKKSKSAEIVEVDSAPPLPAPAPEPMGGVEEEEEEEYADSDYPVLYKPDEEEDDDIYEEQ